MRLLLPVTCCLLALMIVTPPAARAAEAKDPQPTVDTSPSTATLSVLLVGDGNQFLEQALKALGLKQLAQVKPEEYEKAATDKAGAAGGRPFDVIVFDRCRPKRAARARGVLMFGELPPDAALPTIPDEQHPDQPARLDAARADRWDDRHPALMHVQMRRLWVRDGIRLDATRVPAEWNVVVGCQQGPLILERRRKPTEIEPGQNQMVVTFPLDQTNWAMRPSFPVFMLNVIPLLAAEPVVEKKP